MISAHSGAHSFDVSQFNVSHVISHFSFGKKVHLKMLSKAKRLAPYLGESIDRLTGRSYITNHADHNANVTVRTTMGSFLQCPLYEIQFVEERNYSDVLR